MIIFKYLISLLIIKYIYSEKGQSAKCEKVSAEATSWNLDEGSKWFANGSDNDLTYSFTNVNSSQTGICFNIDYFATQPVELLTYLNKNRINGMKYYLSKGDANAIKICTRDFIINTGENFQISFRSSVADDTKFYIISVKIVKEQFSAPQPDPIKWDRMKPDDWDKLFKNVIASQPAITFNSDKTNKKIQITANHVESKDKHVITITTDWIQYEPKLKSTYSGFTVNIGSSLKDNLDISTRILSWSNDKLQNLQLELTPIITTDKDQNLKITVSRDQPSAFKIVVQVTLNPKTDGEHAYDISISKLAVGDACVDNDNKPICTQHVNSIDACTPLSHFSYQCNCEDGYHGKGCIYNNQCKVNIFLKFFKAIL